MILGNLEGIPGTLKPSKNLQIRNKIHIQPILKVVASLADFHIKSKDLEKGIECPSNLAEFLENQLAKKAKRIVVVHTNFR